MEEERDNLSLPDDYPAPHPGNIPEPNREETHSSAKCSPNLLQMLKASEKRRTAYLNGDRAEVSEASTQEAVAEALKTDMVRL